MPNLNLKEIAEKWCYKCDICTAETRTLETERDPTSNWDWISCLEKLLQLRQTIALEKIAEGLSKISDTLIDIESQY